MPLDQNQAINLAVKDLSSRLNVAENTITLSSNESAEFSNACLDSAKADEMCAQMMLRGWRLKLSCQGNTYEYRAAKNQVRLFNFNGQNYKIYP
ncbi:MAG: hypothetical protein HY819_05165 [Acidobacteria bacterium]|nr:hypothetical protein [Acidobacteriota bacterium]